MHPDLERLRTVCKEINDLVEETTKRHPDVPFDVVVIIAAKKPDHATAHTCVVATTMLDEDLVAQTLKHVVSDVEANRVQTRWMIGDKA